MSEAIRFVNDSTALLAMRDSDFDADSAFGEIVDNSIQAEAKKIIVKTKTEINHKGYEILESISFSDNGFGMPSDILRRCLQLGYSTRFNDRKGIGRFGVGMTLASINQCKRIEVYSKQKGNSWLWTYIDIDEIISDPPIMDSIPDPLKKEPKGEFSYLQDYESGSLVIWKHYDRQPETASKMIEKMHEWLGRTYRYFIWDGLEISIDGESVHAIDPLYVNWNKTKFTDDPPGHEYDPILLTWPVLPDIEEEYGDSESTIKIRISLVHKSLRPNQGSGNAKKTKDRYIHHNQGISIVRNNREVAYGPIPYWPGSMTWFNEIDRWWGCEISFDAVLDSSFTVRNIKRGSVPVKELKDTIYDKIKPTIKTCLDEVQKIWVLDKEEKKEEQKKKEKLTTGHEEAEEIAKKTQTDKTSIDKDKDFDKEAKGFVEQIKGIKSEEDKAAWIAKWKDQPFTIMEDYWDGYIFFETAHLGGSDVLRFNYRHSFFEQITKIIDDLEQEESLSPNAVKLKYLIDLLLISYSKAEGKFEPETTMTAEDFNEMLRANWGLYLKNYLSTWLKEATNNE